MPATPEQRARIQIDAQLSAAGWTIQDISTLNLSASRGVAIRELRSQGGAANDVLFDRSVVVPDQLRTVIRTLRKKLFTEIFTARPARAKAVGLDEPWVPKTLIFAKDDSHAEDIVCKEFGKGNDFCKKVTYRASGKSEEIIKAFRTAAEFRIAVTVDMIATGTDIKLLECLLFLRDVRSQLYFEQMKGRVNSLIPKLHEKLRSKDTGVFF